MDTRFLESLLAVVESGSIAGAARQQGLTAAAVSQRIKVLETELGIRLLSRSAQSAKPTRECLEMLPAARALIRDAERLTTHLAPDGLSGPYRLGVISTALLDYVPEVVRKFREKAPGVQLNVRPGSSQVLYETLIAGRIDAAICVAPPFAIPKDIKLTLLAKEPFRHIRPAKDVRDEAGGALPWILYDRSTWGGRLIAGHFETAAREAPVLCELDSLETIAAMVEIGLGQAFVPEWPGMRRHFSAVRVSRLGSGQQFQRAIVLLQKASSTAPSIDLFVEKALSGRP